MSECTMVARVCICTVFSYGEYPYVRTGGRIVNRDPHLA